MKLQSCMAVAVCAFSFSAVSSWATDANSDIDNSVTSPDQAAVNLIFPDQQQSDQGGPGGGNHGGGGGNGGGNHGGGGGNGGGNHGGGGGNGGGNHGGGGGNGGGNHGGGGGNGHPGHGAQPYPVHGGHYPWPHWPHPGFERPVYGWDWDHLRVVTCTAINDAGDLFPVTEDGYVGLEFQGHLAEIEDAAIDRCYNETGGDESCRLLDCEAGY